MRRLSTITGLILAMLIAAASICHADSAISYPLVESPDGTEHILAIQYPGTDTWRIIRIPSSVLETALSNPMTTAQDIIVGGTGGTPGRLAVGGAGSILGVNSSGELVYLTTISISDSDYQFYDSADTTKQALFELGSISTGTQRIYTLPNADGTIALESYVDSQIALALADLGVPSVSITIPSADGSWVDSATYTSLAGSASCSALLTSVQWKLESGGAYASVTADDGDITDETSEDWSVSSITLSEGLNTIYLLATGTNAWTDEETRTINCDLTDPVVAAGSDQTHDGSGEEITISGISITETNENTREYQVYNTTDSSEEQAYTTFTGTSVSYTLPADTDDYQFNFRVTDLASRTGTDSVDVTYSSGGYTAAFRSSDGNTATSGTEVVVTAPSGIQDGDMLVAFAWSEAQQSSITCSGFTEIDNADDSLHQSRTFYKEASSESGDYTWTYSTETSGFGVHIVAISKTGGSWVVPTTTDYHNAAIETSTGVSTGSVTTQDGSVLVVGVSSDATPTLSSGPTDMTQREYDAVGTCRGVTYTQAYETGSSGVTKNATWDSSTLNSAAAVVLYAQ